VRYIVIGLSDFFGPVTFRAVFEEYGRLGDFTVQI